MSVTQVKESDVSDAELPVPPESYKPAWLFWLYAGALSLSTFFFLVGIAMLLQQKTRKIGRNVMILAAVWPALIIGIAGIGHLLPDHSTTNSSLSSQLGNPAIEQPAAGSSATPVYTPTTLAPLVVPSDLYGPQDGDIESFRNTLGSNFTQRVEKACGENDPRWLDFVFAQNDSSYEVPIIKRELMVQPCRLMTVFFKGQETKVKQLWMFDVEFRLAGEVPVLPGISRRTDIWTMQMRYNGRNWLIYDLTPSNNS